jgi:hypothetical protein
MSRAITLLPVLDFGTCYRVNFALQMGLLSAWRLIYLCCLQHIIDTASLSEANLTHMYRL